MFRCFSVLVAGVLTASVAAQDTKQDPKQDPKQEAKQPAGDGTTTVTWHGQSFFEVKSAKGTVFVFDPHAIPEYNRIEGVRPDVIMLSHNHNDHTQVSIFDNINDKGDKAPVILSGLSKGAGGREDWNIIDPPKEVKDLKIRSIGAYHDDVQGMKHGKVAIFIVEVDGWRICHLGDLGHQLSKKQLKELGDIDVLMIPCGGIYGLNGSEAQRVLRQIKPKAYVFPMHIGNRRYEDLLPVDEFIDDNPYPIAIVRNEILVVNKNPRMNVAWLQRETKRPTEWDNVITLERDPNRKEPVVVNLNYWPQENKKKK